MEKIHDYQYSSPEEAAKNAQIISYSRDAIVTISCEDKESYNNICAYLQNDEDCEGYTENGNVYEHWGHRHMNCGTGTWRIHVTIGDNSL